MIDSGSLDAESVKPANRQQLALFMVKLPIIGRPLCGHIVIDVFSQRAQNLSLNHPGLKRDEAHVMQLRSRSCFLPRGIGSGLQMAGSNIGKKPQLSDNRQDNEKGVYFWSP